LNQVTQMFIDTHCHLDFAAFDPDRLQVMAQCGVLGVSAIIVPSVGSWNWSRVQQLCRPSIRQSGPRLYPALGMHPCFLERHGEDDLSRFIERAQADDQGWVAVGEIGVDFLRRDLDGHQQLALCKKQLQVAGVQGLPAILHVRKAHDRVIALLRGLRFAHGGVVHAFSGSLQQAGQYLQLGFRLGLGGAVTHPRATRLRRMAAALPAGAFVLETDAPDMAPAFAAGRRNTPENIPRIAAVIAELRGQGLEQLAAETSATARAVFSLG
jgi:TatD DNase family protein